MTNSSSPRADTDMLGNSGLVQPRYRGDQSDSSIHILHSLIVQVVIKDSHEDTGLCGQIGVVRGVTPGMCSVFLHEEERWVWLGRYLGVLEAIYDLL